MPAILRLYEDVLASDSPEVGLPPAPRMIFVVHGSATFEGRHIGDGEAWHGEHELMIEPGPAGVTWWRFELVSTDASEWLLGGAATRKKLAAALATLPKGELLLRGDSVAFPPGGCAYLHRHRGPGIRCLIEGGIRIDTLGHSTSYGPGSAWYESGPDPVFAQAAADRPSRFIRVLILPRELLGKSSLELVNDEDKGKPRSQQYQIFADAPIAFAAT